MAEYSDIGWTHSTFNPWEGYTAVSPGCMNCYAWARNRRFSDGINWGKGAPRRRTSIHNWNEPRRWNAHEQRAFQKYGPRLPHVPRHRVFCASLADWLDDEVPIEWLADLLQLVFECQELDWQLLTKRPENWKDRLALALNYFTGNQPATAGNMKFADWLILWLNGKAPANVWIGTTVEDQQRADERIPLLRMIPARVRFLSCEPLLGPLDIFSAHTIGRRANAADARPPGDRWIDWVICGGESGPGARPMNPDWARGLRDQCKAAAVPFFFKQWGEWADFDHYNPCDDSSYKSGKMDQVFIDGKAMNRVGKLRAGRLLDGIEHNEFPK